MVDKNPLKVRKIIKMKKTDKEKMHNDIKKHGEQLNNIFHTEFGPVELCKKLFRIENKVHTWSEYYCNGNINMEQWESTQNRALKQLDKILNFKVKNIPVFINGDPRGYALKIDDEYVRENNLEVHRDWGGYGILAPDFTPDK